MNKKELVLVSFNEDNFEIDSYKKTANTRTHSRVKRARRQVIFGKIMLAVVSLAVVFLLYYVITVLITRQGQIPIGDQVSYREPLHFQEYREDHWIALSALPNVFL